MRPHFSWRLRTRTLELGRRTLVMGIVNVTPDSFSDGGEFFHTDLAVEHALRLLDEGADIVDIGGESTRPGQKEPLDALEEARRVIPVIKSVLRERPGTLISIDTYRAETAERAAHAGAEIINDVSGLLWDPAMSDTIARTGCGCVLMHTRGRPDEWKHLPRLSADEVVPLVKGELSEIMQKAMDAGVPRETIMIDPGFGFGKRWDENYPLLAHFDAFAEFGFPLLAGASRKSFIAHTLSQRFERAETTIPERLHGTLAANVAAILKGAHVLRVHDVRPAVEAAAVADKILAADDR
jgi:dihydropteroate synthase